MFIDLLRTEKSKKRKRGEAKTATPTTPVCLVRATDGKTKLSTHVTIFCFVFAFYFGVYLRNALLPTIIIYIFTKYIINILYNIVFVCVPCNQAFLLALKCTKNTRLFIVKNNVGASGR
jgi:hypothetical protein